jgi:type II secretory pathway component PulF
MPVCKYLARNRSGRIVRGELTVMTPVELRSKLNAMDLALISYTALPGRFGLNWLELFDPRRLLPVSGRDIELLLHQLSLMLRSGIKLQQSLKALQLQSEKAAMSKMLESLGDEVAKGGTLSLALSKHKVIPSIVVCLVEIGEQTGNLNRVLTQARDYLVQRRATLSELQFAMIYPAMVCLGAISIAAYLVLVVIPQLQTFLAVMGRKLPAMTQSLMDLSQWLSVNSTGLVFLVVAMLAGISFLLYSSQGRQAVDRYILRIPIFGEILRLSGTAALSSTLTVMLQSGIKLVDALRTANRVQSNRYLAALILKANQAVSNGQPLAPSLSVKHGFATILGSMIEVAERTGHLEKTLDEAAIYCKAELQSRLKRMTQLMEPAVMLFAGCIVGYVYVAFFLALMSAGGNIR